MRKDGRRSDELRPITIERNFQPQANGSLLMKMGDTHVVCAVTVEEKVPPFLLNSGQGWITAEYGMLPCSASSRMGREAVRGRSGRTHEIQRLIGRSLRMMVDLRKLGERTLRVDCDVIRADGGTRTAAISGAALAVREVLDRLHRNGLLTERPAITQLAAISVGLVNGQPLLDLDYVEDSAAEADANFVMTEDGRLVEVQCTAEKRPFSREEFDRLATLARQGVEQLLKAIADAPDTARLAGAKNCSGTITRP